MRALKGTALRILLPLLSSSSKFINIEHVKERKKIRNENKSYTNAPNIKESSRD